MSFIKPRLTAQMAPTTNLTHVGNYAYLPSGVALEKRKLYLIPRAWLAIERLSKVFGTTKGQVVEHLVLRAERSQRASKEQNDVR